MVRLSVACAALAAAAVALGAQPGGAGVASAQDFKLYGVNYNVRAGADWEPEATKCKSAATIAKELATLKTVTDTIRLYSLTDCNQGATVLPAAVKAGLKVSLGLWVGPEPATFAAEQSKLQELLAQDGLVTAKDVVGIHVGSEAVYRGDVNTTVAIANFRAVKQLVSDKALGIPVTIADIGDVYLAHPELVDAVDFVSANAFPFWEKIDADKAAAYLYSRLQPLIAQAAAQGKDVLIGETGWATAGVHADASDATPENAATYFRDFYALAQQHALKYFYFAGFDEQWKIATSAANSTVEAYFGLFDKDGALKAEYKALQLSGNSTSTITKAENATTSGGNATASGASGSGSTPASGVTVVVPSAGTIHAGPIDSAVTNATAESVEGNGGVTAGGASAGGKGSAIGGAASGKDASASTTSNSVGAATPQPTSVTPSGKGSASTGGKGSVPSTPGAGASASASSGAAPNPAKQSANKRKDCDA